jgi:hypothetical protein
MKKFFVILSIAASLSVPQTSHASEQCEITRLGAMMMFMTLTLAPTGTSFWLSVETGNCREEVLAIKEDAQQFAITGEVSPLLQTAFAGAKSVHPGMSNDEMAVRFIGLNLEAK